MKKFIITANKAKSLSDKNNPDNTLEFTMNEILQHAGWGHVDLIRVSNKKLINIIPELKKLNYKVTTFKHLNVDFIKIQWG